ncbi:MAG: HlyD family efflux transporter periplasmic adaptor subunit [Phycisphaeraceae bacterium]
MAIEQATITQEEAAWPRADLVEALRRGEGSPQQVLERLLVWQMRLARAQAGAILSVSQQAAQPVAARPAIRPGAAMPPWLNRAVELLRQAADPAQPVGATLSATQTYPPLPEMSLLVVPLLQTGPARLVCALLSPRDNGADRASVVEALRISAVMLDLYQARATTAKQAVSIDALSRGMEVLAQVGGHDRFAAAAMATANTLAAMYGAARVSLGVVRRGQMRIEAMSHTEKIVRKTRLVRDLVAVMEECADQDVEILHPLPAAPGAAGATEGGATGGEATGGDDVIVAQSEAESDAAAPPYISRATADFARQYDGGGVLAMPVRRESKVQGVLVVERGLDRPLSAQELTTLRLACELVTPTLLTLSRHDRWLGAKTLDALHRSGTTLVGPRHTWAKLTAVSVVLAVLALVFIPGTDHVDGSFVIEPVTRRVMPAPYDGFLAVAMVEPGDRIVAGAVLARMQTWELEGRLAEAQGELAEHQGQAELARRDGKTAERQIAEAQARRVTATTDLLQQQLNQARIVAPIDGVVLSGDWKQHPGEPVKTGQALFEIAPLDEMRAQVMVPEARISDVRVGQRGDLATAAQPGVYLPVEVERINPMAEVIEDANVYRVQVKLMGQAKPANGPAKAALLPGMQGAARLDAGRHSIGYLWTRDMINFIRMKLWM